MAFGPVLLILAAIEFAFLFALVTRLNWQGGGLVVLVATGLAGGAVFTALEMHRLGKKDR